MDLDTYKGCTLALWTNNVTRKLSQTSDEFYNLYYSVMTAQTKEEVDAAAVIFENVKKMAQLNADGRMPVAQVDFEDSDQVLYIDNGRIDPYEAIGSQSRPFKTIAAAGDYIAQQGNNTIDYPYTMIIAPGIYEEELFIEHPNFVNINVEGAGDPFQGKSVIIQGSINSTQNNENLKRLQWAFVSLKGNCTISNSTNHSGFLSHGLFARRSNGVGNVTLKNIPKVRFSSIDLEGNYYIENCPDVTIDGLPGQDMDEDDCAMCDIVWDEHAPKPVGATETFVSAFGTTLGRVIVSRLWGGSATLRVRSGTLLGQVLQTTIIGEGCTLLDEGCRINGKIDVEKGGHWINNTLSFNTIGTSLTATNIACAIRELAARFKVNCITSEKMPLVEKNKLYVWTNPTETLLLAKNNEGYVVSTKLETVQSNFSYDVPHQFDLDGYSDLSLVTT